MGAYKDKMSTLTLRVESPDHQIIASLRQGRKLDLAFADRSYGNYSEESLQFQLGQLGRLLVVEQRRAHYEALSFADGRTITPADERPDDRDRRYLKRLAETVSRGESSRRLIRVETKGLRDWRVRIRQGTLARLSETDFVAELGEAIAALMADYRRNVRRHVNHVYP